MGKRDEAKFSTGRNAFRMACVGILLVANVPARAAGPLELAGLWRDGDGNVLQISQSGSAIKAVAFRLAHDMMGKFGWSVGDVSFEGVLQSENKTVSGTIHQRFPIAVQKNCPNPAEFGTPLQLEVQAGIPLYAGSTIIEDETIAFRLNGTWKAVNLQADCVLVTGKDVARTLERFTDRAQILPLESVGKFPANFRVDTKVTRRDPFRNIAQTGNLQIAAFHLASDTDAIEKLTLNLSSDTDPAGLPVLLVETSPHSDLFLSERAISLSSQPNSQQPSGAAVLRASQGDRIYLRDGAQMKDIAFVIGNGSATTVGYGKGAPPAWRIPDSKAQYLAMRDAWGHPRLTESIQTEGKGLKGFIGNQLLTTEVFEFESDYFHYLPAKVKAILKDPRYKTAEELIAAKWINIQAAAARQKIPPTLLGGVLLQQMRSMNFEDLLYDGFFVVGPKTFDSGDTIGISQTPIYIVQLIAKERGLPAQGIPAGSRLSREQAVDLLFEPDPSIEIAAAFIRMLKDRADVYVAEQKPAIKKLYAANFDVARIKFAGAVGDEERKVAYIIGLNEDQWNIERDKEPYVTTAGISAYGLAVVRAFEDIRLNLTANGRLGGNFTKVARSYVEDTFPAVRVRSNPRSQLPRSAQGKEFWELGYYYGFLPGDITPNMFPRDGLVNDDIKKMIAKTP